MLKQAACYSLAVALFAALNVSISLEYGYVGVGLFDSAVAAAVCILLLIAASPKDPPAPPRPNSVTAFNCRAYSNAGGGYQVKTYSASAGGFISADEAAADRDADLLLTAIGLTIGIEGRIVASPTQAGPEHVAALLRYAAKILDAEVGSRRSQPQ